MARSPRLTSRAADAAVAAITALLDGGALRLYSGAQPAEADDPVRSQTLLAELRFATPAFRAPVDGVAEAEPLMAEPNAPATGTATWFRAIARDGARVLDGSIGPADADLVLSTTLIQAGAEISVTRFTVTAPREG